ncbi:hypothetical protein GWK47_029270 [Chionoecetes opilio]|uniref:Uncharacterized protein n=1 Tax=Chionoecetes opilio TaxID=41210 RepID=A0A8J4YY47_CHIOP|nr:hypothetical protein GWK47_029270 [Chionoecetes opilio]
MDPVASCKESTNPWPTESDGGLERGVLKRSSSPSVPRLPRAAHRAWVQATKKRTVVTTDGTRLRSERRNIRSIGLFPQASPHADHDAGCRRCVGPHKDLGPHRSSSFHRCPRRRRHSRLAAPCGAHRRSAREKMAKEIKAEMTVKCAGGAAHHTLDGKLVEGMAGEGIVGAIAHPGVR